MSTNSTKNASEMADSDRLLALTAPAAVLRYRHGFTALAFLLALSPIWFFWSIFAVFTLVAEAFANISAGVAGTEVGIATILFYLLLVAVGLLAVNVSADTKLIVNKEGLRLPWQFLFDSKFCLSRPWSTLVSV